MDQGIHPGWLVSNDPLAQPSPITAKNLKSLVPNIVDFEGV